MQEGTFYPQASLKLCYPQAGHASFFPILPIFPFYMLLLFAFCILSNGFLFIISN